MAAMQIMLVSRRRYATYGRMTKEQMKKECGGKKTLMPEEKEHNRMVEETMQQKRLAYGVSYQEDGQRTTGGKIPEI